MAYEELKEKLVKHVEILELEEQKLILKGLLRSSYHMRIQQEIAMTQRHIDEIKQEMDIAKDQRI